MIKKNTHTHKPQTNPKSINCINDHYNSVLTTLAKVPSSILLPAGCVINPQNQNEILFLDAESNDITVYNIDNDDYSVRKGCFRRAGGSCAQVNHHRRRIYYFAKGFTVMDTEDKIGYVYYYEQDNGIYCLDYMVYDLSKKMWILHQPLLTNKSSPVSNGYSLQHDNFLLICGYFDWTRILMFRLEPNKKYRLVKMASIPTTTSLYLGSIIILPQSCEFVNEILALADSSNEMYTADHRNKKQSTNIICVLAVKGISIFNGSFQLLIIDLCNNIGDDCINSDSNKNPWFKWYDVNTSNGLHLIGDSITDFESTMKTLKDNQRCASHFRSCLVNDRYVVFVGNTVSIKNQHHDIMNMLYFDLKSRKWNKVHDRIKLSIHSVGYLCSNHCILTTPNCLYVMGHSFRDGSTCKMNKNDTFVRLRYDTWDTQRVLWIAYCKEKHSQFYRLPKVIIHYIIDCIYVRVFST